MEGVTFIECHRDWSLVGSSILNFVGALNIPEGKDWLMFPWGALMKIHQKILQS